MSSVKEITTSVTPYIPFRLLHKLTNPSGHAIRRTEQMEGGLMFVDLAGFTILTESIAETGPRGSEALNDILSRFYDEMLQRIRESGGVVYQYAGDSVLIAFIRHERETQEECAWRITLSALRIIRDLSHFSNVEILGNSYALRAKIGLSYGDFNQILLGTWRYWYNPSIVGKPVEEAIDAEKFASGGEIIANRKLWELLPPEKTGEVLESDFIKVFSVPEKDLDSGLSFAIPEEFLNEKFLKRCSKFIAPAIYNKITGGFSGFIGDFRDVTGMFIRFDGINYHENTREAVNQLNSFYEYVQQMSDRYGGILLQTDLTDKGNVFLVIFGAPHAQENKENLACRLAVMLQEEKKRFPFINNIQIGISTGKTYCGDLGSSLRKGYTVVSGTINLASRLMTFAQDSSIHVDENTESKIRKTFNKEKIEKVKFKGIEESQDIFRIESEIKRFRGILLNYAREEFVGRRTELEKLERAMTKSFDEEGQISVIMGEAGIGKSRLTGELLARLENYNAEPLIGYCYSYEKFTPFFPWKELFLNYFQILDFDEEENRIAKIEFEFNQLENVSSDWIPVLADIMGIRMEEKPLTRNLEARQKNERIFQIVFQLLEKKARETPLLIFFEDYHWVDEISLNLINYIAARIHTIPAHLLLVARRDADTKRLEGNKNYQLIDLKELSDEDSRSFLRLKLQLDAPNPTFEDLILSRAHGNPFFIESIAQTLIEQSYLVKTAGGKYTVAGDSQEIKIPDSLQDVVLTRIDRLSEKEKTLLKTASVIGRIFAYDTLLHLSPESIQDQMKHLLGLLGTLDLTPLETEEPLSFIFKHMVIRDVAYNTLLISTREEIHVRLANYLEEKSAEKASEAADILSYHFLAGNDREQGLKYTLIAARKAQERYANKDAVHHYKKALELIETTNVSGAANSPEELKEELAWVYLREGKYEEAITLFKGCLAFHKDPLRKANILTGIGQVYQERGDTNEAIDALEKALKFSGRRPPGGKIGTILGLLGQIILRLGHSAFPFLIRRVSENKRGPYHKQLSLTIILAKIYFFADIEKLVWANFTQINVAEKINTDEDLANSYASFALILCGMGLLGGSRTYFEKSLDLADKVGDPLLKALCLSRYGTLGMFINDPDHIIKYEGEAVILFKEIGEIWEQLVAFGSMIQGHLYKSEFDDAYQGWVDFYQLALEFDSRFHQGWAMAWIPFYKYFLFGEPAAPLKEQLKEAVKVTEEVNDQSTRANALMNLAYISVREEDPEEAARWAQETFEVIKNYRVIVPHTQIAFVHAGEAALYAYKHKARALPAKKLLNIAKISYKKTIGFGKNFSYLLGSGLRLKAQYLEHTGASRSKVQAAYQKALEVLEGQPNHWELGMAYYHAGVALPGKRTEYFKNAKSIFIKYNINAEIKRIEGFEKQTPPDP